MTPTRNAEKILILSKENLVVKFDKLFNNHLKQGKSRSLNL